LNKADSDPRAVNDGVPNVISKLLNLRTLLVRNRGIDIFDTVQSVSRLKTSNGKATIRISNLSEPTSYNLAVELTGTIKGSRFVRKDLVSILAH
jgi:hypothetical protein